MDSDFPLYSNVQHKLRTKTSAVYHGYANHSRHFALEYFRVDSTPFFTKLLSLNSHTREASAMRLLRQNRISR